MIAPIFESGESLGTSYIAPIQDTNKFQSKIA
jgi:hypothetical protein